MKLKKSFIIDVAENRYKVTRTYIYKRFKGYFIDHETPGYYIKRIKRENYLMLNHVENEWETVAFVCYPDGIYTPDPIVITESHLSSASDQY